MIPDSPLADTLTRLRQDIPGKAEYTRESVDNGHWETAWVIYDNSQNLTAQGAEPTVEFRTGAFDEGGVVVLPILLRVSFNEPGQIYETWMNAYQIEGKNVYLQDLAQQDHIRIHLYGEPGQLLGTLMVPNSLQTLAQNVLERQTAYQPSTPAAFEYARDKLYAACTDVQALWRVLGQRERPIVEELQASQGQTQHDDVPPLS
jgi:hypothetical protein